MMKQKTKAPKFKAAFVDCDEGLSGEYDPKDPSDIHLLRIDVQDQVDGQWDTIVENGSTCTLVPIDTDETEKQRLLDLAVEYVEKAERQGGSLKRAVERLSWMEPGWKAEDFEEGRSGVMKWFVFVGGFYSGDTGEEGTKIIELEDGCSSAGHIRDTRDVWAYLMDRGLCGSHMNDVKLDGINGTELRVFKAEEIDFPFLDAYVAEREARETRVREDKKREAEEEELRNLASKLGYKIEKQGG
jgi:hypothetical protein